MKRKIFSVLFALVLILSFSLIPATSVGADPGPGIVGLWHFDEGSGTTASDSSGNANHGTLKPLNSEPTWVSGKLGNALSFDGSNDYVEIANESNFDFERDAAFTLEAWVKTSSNAQTMRIITKMQNSGDKTGWSLNTYDDDTTGPLLYFVLRNNNTNKIRVHGSSDITDGLWHHVAVTYDGSSSASGVQIYVDGSPETMTTTDNNLTASTLNNVKLQISGREGSNYVFDGLIDEVRIWDQALSAEEIAVLASGTCVPPPSGMVSWWPGDTDASDIQDANDGVLTNGALAGVTGKVDGAFSFDGSDDYVNVADSASLDISGAITVEAWVNVSIYTSGKVYTIAGKWNDKDGDYRAYLLALSTKETGSPLPKFYISSTGTNFPSAVSPQSLNAGTWYHLAGTFDGDVLKIYVDGVEKGSTDLGSSTTIATNDEPLLIGGNKAGGTGAAYFNGLIDEVEIFDRALSAPEILAIYNAGSAGKCKEVVIEVDIDIKPGSDPNSINLKSKGVVPVAVLTTGDFDASDVAPTTVEFAGASPVRWTMENVDGDTDMDMLLHFKTQDLNLDEDSTEATLTGKTLDEVDITGTDTVNIVPKGKK